MNQELTRRLVTVDDYSALKQLEKRQVVDVTRADTTRHFHDYRVIFDNDSNEISFYYPVPVPERGIVIMITRREWVHPTKDGLLLVNTCAYERRMRLTSGDEGYEHMKQDLFNLGLVDETGKKIIIPG